MKTPRKPSPARSEGVARTPIRHKHRRTISVSSARSNASGILSALVHQRRNMESFVVSPLTSRKSILSDNTDIDEPKRKSWWKNLGENSRDVIELLEENKIVEPNNIIEELDIEVLSQENRNYTMDLPESSGSESISSIVIPQRKLFTQKENLPQKKFGEIIGNRESLAKLHKTNTGFDKTINVGTRELFQNKQRSKPIFPAALLNISPNKTAADKTKELAAIEPKSQVRNIFGNRATKRKNIFTNFIVSESEDEISEIQPKVFGFQKKIEARRRGSSSSRGIREPSPTSSITTDIEMDDWKMLPSSTMVETQLEIMMAGQSPKRARLSKLIEIESEIGSNATKSSKSGTSKEDKSRKSKTFTMEKAPEYQSMNTRNTFRISLDEQEEIFTQNQDVLDKFSITEKSRKSKTFTKEKAPDELMTTKNKSKISQDDDDEEIFDRNRDTEISRKSKTFTKEKGTDSETTNTTRNKSKISQDVQNKSKSKIVDPNMSQSSMKTRSQSKNNSPNTSQIIKESTSKSDAESKTISSAKNILEAQTTADQENDDDDDELNFSLQYDNENNEDQDIRENQEIEEPKTQNKSITKSVTLKSVSEVNQRESTTNISKLNKSLAKKVIDESADLESSQKKSNRSMKGRNKSQDKHTSYNDEMEINDEEPNNHSNDKSQDRDIEIKNKVVENDIDNEEVHEEENVHEEQNKSEVEDEDKIEEVSINEEEQDQSENKRSQEIEDEVEDNIESQEVEEENQEENQNESQAQLEQNQTIAQEQEDEIEMAQDTSKKEKQDESGIQDSEKKHESFIADNEKQNESTIQETDEQNESDNKDQNESAIQETDKNNESYHEEKNESAIQETDKNNESYHEEKNESVIQETDEHNESDTEERNQSAIQEADEQNESDNEELNQSAIQETDEQNESDNDELNQSDIKKTGEHNESDNEELNQSAIQETDEQNESDNDEPNQSAIQETDEHNKSDNEEQNECSIQETDEDNECDIEEQNESAVQEIGEQNDSDNEEQNESGVQETDEQNESDNEEQNESAIHETDENNESDNEVQHESAVQETDENNESDNEEQHESAVQEIDELNDSENEVQNESAVLENNKKTESSIQENKEHTNNEHKKQDNDAQTESENEKQPENEVAAENASALLAKSNVFFDGTKNSSAEGSGWDSHRTTRKTIRQTYGRELTPRKSLRALVMEKSAKRQTQHNELASVTNYFPQANSTEMQESNRYDDDDDQENHDAHEVSFRTRQTTLELYLQEVKKKNAETRLKIEEEVRSSLNAPSKYHIFKVPAKPMFARRTKTVPKPKETAKSTKIFGELPTEFIEDMKYKPPKRFQPRDAPWITKHLYKFLETKLEPKYDYKARVRAEKLVENIYYFAKDLRRRDAATSDSVDVLKREMARLNVVNTHFEFYEFFHQFMPREVRIKVIPDVVNKISLPRHGVFADIL